MLCRYFMGLFSYIRVSFQGCTSLFRIDIYMYKSCIMYEIYVVCVCVCVFVRVGEFVRVCV